MRKNDRERRRRRRRRGNERKQERERERRQGEEEPSRRGEGDAAVGGSPLLVLVPRVLRTRLYLSNRCSLAPRLASSRRDRCSTLLALCHLHTRNKSNNKIIMARGNASYLSLAIVYRRLSSRFFKLNCCPPSWVVTLLLPRDVRPFAQAVLPRPCSLSRVGCP